MPTYEYACKACDHRFEIVQSFAEDALTTCPDCEQDALRKVYNAAGIIFKGDGWHIKDYAKTAKSGSSSTSTSNGDNGSSSTSSSASSETIAPKKSKKKGAAGDRKAGDASSTASRPAAG